MRWDAAAEKTLASAVIVGTWHLTSGTIVPVARLIQAGLLEANDECGWPRLRPTEAGIQAALRRKLVWNVGGTFIDRKAEPQSA